MGPNLIMIAVCNFKACEMPLYAVKYAHSEGFLQIPLESLRKVLMYVRKNHLRNVPFRIPVLTKTFYLAAVEISLYPRKIQPFCNHKLRKL